MEKVWLFSEKHAYSIWVEEAELWYLSSIDIAGVLTDSPNPRKYRSVLKTRLKKEVSQLATDCSQLKLKAVDGKNCLTGVENAEQVPRFIQSTPSQNWEKL
jgi:hypothetical protein